MKATAAARPFVGGPEIGRCEGGDDADVHAGDERPDGEQRGPREAIDDDGSDDDGKALQDVAGLEEEDLAGGEAEVAEEDGAVVKERGCRRQP
jgi:hypothetical protein